MNIRIIGIISIVIIGIGITSFSIFQDNSVESIKNSQKNESGELMENEIMLKIENQNSETDDSQYTIIDREWQTSGPFSIDRKEYALGEKIFMAVSDLKSEDNGQIVLLRHLNQTHSVIWKSFPFDGEKNSSFNIYFEPKPAKIFHLCDKNDIMGEWSIKFKNTNYMDLNFKINEKIVPGDEERFNNSVC